MKNCKFVDENGIKCEKRASFSKKNTSPEHCGKHREPENVDNYHHKYCRENECINKAVVGIESDPLMKCIEHIEEGMKNYNKYVCKFKDGNDTACCFENATNNFKNEETPILCSEHKENNMIDLKYKYQYCQYDNKCIIIATFNYEGHKAKLCLKHKEEGMIDVKHKTCKDCNKIPTFNYEGQLKGLYCVTHKKDGMIDVKSKTCKYAICKKRPIFNYEGQPKGLYCAKHKEEDMINVISKICFEDGCNTLPVFNFEGQLALYCSNHKKEGMVDVIHDICEEKNCTTLAYFNFLGETKGRFCKKDKLENMVNVRNKICEKCHITQASFGLAGHELQYCAKCKTKQCIVDPRRKCQNYKICKKLALFGITKHLRRENCKEENDINLLYNKCTNCHLEGIVNRDNKCDDCTAFPTARLAKQNEVVAFLQTNIFQQPTSVDIMLEKGDCGLERPDIVYDCGTHIFIVEVDENRGHKHIKEDCEYARMINISQSAEGRPVIFIRYNPDNFKGSEKGKEKMPTTNERLLNLKRWTEYCINNKPKEFLQVMYLYYDGYVEGNEEMQVLIKYEDNDKN